MQSVRRLIDNILARPGTATIARAKITAPTGALPIGSVAATCVIVVGPSFDQDVPTAMMTFRMGYAKAFESLGIPYLFVDLQDLAALLPELPGPFCMLNGADYLHMDLRTIRQLRNYPHAVWVDPWFAGSDHFFSAHQLDARIWHWSDEHRERIVTSAPAFVHTATVPGGLCFFEKWATRGLQIVSLPLACDTSLYRIDVPLVDEFVGIPMAFVGGHWESKGLQLDRYLRPFEDQLVVYGYSWWPYRGYRGLLPREVEPALYRQALVSPVINEPSVPILQGQINERIFKVLGSGGVPLVDAVPAYRELFREDELFIPRGVDDFIVMARQLLRDEGLRERSRKGREAVLARHTYRHRALQMLDSLGLSGLVARVAEPILPALLVTEERKSC